MADVVTGLTETDIRTVRPSDEARLAATEGPSDGTDGEDPTGTDGQDADDTDGQDAGGQDADGTDAG